MIEIIEMFLEKKNIVSFYFNQSLMWVGQMLLLFTIGSTFEKKI
jgi:hypothetical protein